MKQKLAIGLLVLAALAGEAPAVDLHWLDQSPPPAAQGVSWGVPWPQGQVQKDATFLLTDPSGKSIPVQTWPLAYWPDGSIKWTGFAATAAPDMANSFTLQSGSLSALSNSPLKIEQTDQFIEITAGDATWHMSRAGQNLVDSISIAGKTVAADGRLVGQIEDRSDWDSQQILRFENFTSQIDSVTLEQSGPVRAVVKITGKHKFDSSSRTWLPFIVRFYFYAGSDAVKMVHTFIFDGDQAKDFISKLGIRWTVPLREEFQNRHVRLSGDQGFFAEPIRLIAGRRDPNSAMYSRQIAGQRIPTLAKLPLPRNVADMAVWDAYKLTQLTDGGFAIQKRTNPQSAWINAAGGNRSLGLAFVGDVSGGLSVDLKNFWQLNPTEMEIEGASTDAATLTIWLWSPEAQPIDMRHYDIKAHGLEASYEDVQPGYSQAYGVGRTSELMIRPYASVPSDDDLLAEANADNSGALLVCTPEYYHSIPVFGQWSLPDRSTPGKAWIEDQLDKAFTFYRGQVEQRRWYGFWDFGDVMHTYDTERHEWKYDVGGFAWDDTELAPNLWLWYSFLRTGRADVYRMAEALTRQSQEVDVYHIGPWKGLGSRHNVRHWGDGAKEARISQSLFKRFYYYLTTDERMGDLMTDEIDADKALLVVDPVRELAGISSEHKYPTHLRIGPDWFALVSNWYTAWERTGDEKYRDRIFAGMDSITAMPNGIASGANFGFDPSTDKIYMLAPGETPSLLPLFGGPELNFEMNSVLGNEKWSQAWDQFCQRRRDAEIPRMAAYGAALTHDTRRAAQVWRQFLHPMFGMNARGPFDSHPVAGAAVPEAIDEIRMVSTNGTAQWCLNAIELLQFVGDQMPAKDSDWEKRP
jgi:YetA-like protein